MEAAWIVLGGFISTIAGVVGWYLNSRTSREVQERQQRHELAMQAERLEAERQSKREDAVRAMRRERLQPVFDSLADLESEIAYLSVSETLDGINCRPEVKAKVVKDLREHRSPRPDTLFRMAATAARTGDADLAKDILDIWALLQGDNPDTTAAGRALRAVHDRLEEYAVRVAPPHSG